MLRTVTICCGKSADTQAGRLSLAPPFLCFISLDRRSCRCTLPLYTIRRVERYVAERIWSDGQALMPD